MRTHISEKELTWLEDILLNRIDDDEITDGMDEGIIDLSELDGFFTAIVSGPDMISPMQWMPKVWGDYEPEWESVEKLHKVTGIMVAMMNSIVDSLMDEDKMVEPLFNVWPVANKEHLIVEEWCFGYMRGLSLSPSQRVIDSKEVQELLSPITLLGTEAGFELLEKMSDAEIKAMQSQIAPSADKIHAYFLQHRQHLKPMTDILDVSKKDNQALPTYSQQHLETLDKQQLIELMIQNDDRVPRNVIDESAKRGDSMAELLAERVQRDGYDDLDDGQWWMRLHAIMILGLMEGQKAADALLCYFEIFEKNKNDDLQDWLDGYYTALGQNKPQRYFDQLKDKCLKESISLYVKTSYTQALVARAQQQGEQPLEDMLDWVVERVKADDEDEDYRIMLAGSILLDMPRQRYRTLLEELAKQQTGLGAYFGMNDIELSYNDANNRPEWERFSDPWDFYSPKEISARQKRWAEESNLEDNNDFTMSQFSDFDNDNRVETFVHDTPKIGRNDPCLCGSGKKYKKCCLH